ncbi:hypothetical protein I5907_11690 [Panacibacter sp. DH6]|uniref:histidine kinase n=1 Tax=Panacibacter microcysteis TaxID=2793269 RepID=A0A931GWW9_9BACT|nr:histidine kinase [Panacibacter microcysteis]MBG9376903.1 hypothetical protein [Panacibacter microcysteis]
MHEEQINIVSLIIYGTIVMIALLLTIVFFVLIHQRKVIQYQLQLKEVNEAQQKKLTVAAIESEEAERKRISAELHDEVGALLSTVKLYLSQVQPEHLNSDSKIKLLNQSKDLLDESIKTVRNISSNLQPMLIADFGLESTIQHFCNKINQPPVFTATLTVEDAISRMPADKELAVFRIVQEVTNNVIKHSGATYIYYSVVQQTDALEVHFKYNGNGLGQQEYEEKLYHSQGLGLKNMQNRLNILKGDVLYQKNDNLTNTITVKIPFSA